MPLEVEVEDIARFRGVDGVGGERDLVGKGK